MEFGRLDRPMRRLVRRESRRFPWMILRASGLKRRQSVPRNAAATDASKIRGGGFPSRETRGRRPMEAFRRRGREGRREVGLSIAKRVGELANKQNGSSHGRRASHDRFPSIAGRSGLLRDLLQSDVPAFDAYRLRNLVARSVYSAPGDRKRAQLHLSRLRFPADLDLAALVRSSGAGCGSLIAPWQARSAFRGASRQYD